MGKYSAAEQAAKCGARPPSTFSRIFSTSFPALRRFFMQSKQSGALVGQLTLLAIACLITILLLILIEGGRLSYQCGKFLRAWLHQHHSTTDIAQNTFQQEHKAFEPVSDPWDLPLEPISSASHSRTSQLRLLKAPVKPILYLLPPASNPTPDYIAMTIRELKAIARDRRIPNYGRMTKAQLLGRVLKLYERIENIGDDEISIPV
jgi:hypothetical protein